jgi:hypothetical protein
MEKIGIKYRSSYQLGLALKRDLMPKNILTGCTKKGK